VENATESIEPAFNPPKAKACGVLNRDGIFYASLRMQGQEAPWEVALHGVSSEREAQEAFATLVRLRQAQCALPVSPVI
jgi:hypothetical protein